MATVTNRKNWSMVVHAVANTTWQLADFKVGSETTPTGVSIAQVWAGSPQGAGAYWQIKRGANTVAVVDSTTHIDFAGTGCSLGLDSAANVTVELVGSTVGFIMVEVQKLRQQSEYVQQ